MAQPNQHARPKVQLTWLARLWLLGIVVLLATDYLSDTFRMGWLVRIYFWSTLLLSLATFVMFGVDKRRANLDKHRISEKRLHLLAMLGGWPGAVLGQRAFRHKTIKKSFRLVLWGIILLHVCLSAWFVIQAAMDKQDDSNDRASATVSATQLACAVLVVRRGDEIPGGFPQIRFEAN